MTGISDDRLPAQLRGEMARRWFAFALTAVALSVPIAGVFVMVWPYLLARTHIAADGIEVISLAIGTCATGLALASYIHREQGTHL